jgi:hypothetical protein
LIFGHMIPAGYGTGFNGRTQMDVDEISDQVGRYLALKVQCPPVEALLVDMLLAAEWVTYGEPDFQWLRTRTGIQSHALLIPPFETKEAATDAGAPLDHVRGIHGGRDFKVQPVAFTGQRAGRIRQGRAVAECAFRPSRRVGGISTELR